jgi:hypothetical protein
MNNQKEMHFVFSAIFFGQNNRSREGAIGQIIFQFKQNKPSRWQM